jgi:transglutaminase-like putative cysteine protease/tetratricopeptide (TPR) repeat protein
MSAQQMLAEANSVTPGKGDNVVVLLDDDRWVFDKNGDVRQSIHVVFQVLTAQGVEDWSDLSWQWEPWHEERPRIRIRVITPDGTEHLLDQKTVVDAPASDQSNNVYSDARTVKCPLPAMTPGAVVEQDIEVSSKHLLTGMLDSDYFGRSNTPVRLARAYFEYPTELPFRYTAYLLADLKTTKTEKDGVVQLTLEKGPLLPLDENEPMLPPDVPRQPHIVFSTAQSWKDLALEYDRIVEERIGHADVGSLAKNAREGANDRAQTIERLVRALHREVRYTGVEFGDAALIPARPEETLKRKYGDCKDKSALLVSLLRAAGIPSYLALLATGPGEDVKAEHPGMGKFDHAIVYVPGTPDLWIDATAENLPAGFLPSMDQGRRALVIRPETVGLSLIPEAASAADVTVETREFFLPDYGKARVVETTEGTGNADANLRESYGSADAEQLRKNLAKYMREEYIADSALKIEHPKGTDFSQPFRLRLEMDNAKRGSISATDGAVGIPLGGLFENLPDYFKEAEKKPTADDVVKPLKKRTDDFVMGQAFVSEWHYRIHMPAGFQMLNLPAGEKIAWGPATYSSTFHVEKDLVTADFRFDSGKRRYTAAEGEELRGSLAEFLKRPMLILQMEPLGQIYLSKGKFREAIEQYRTMIGQYPNKAVHHVQLSQALLQAGCGEKAREEARRATQLEPKLGLAYQNLGFVLLNDLVGRDFAKGFDSAGSEAALRKALELDPKDQVSRRNLAVTLEYTTDGLRYRSVERLNEAIKVYREMGDELMSNDLEQNLLYDLTYTARYPELRKELDKLALSGLTLALKLVATAKLEDAAAALAQVEKETPSEELRSTALQAAAGILFNMRDYPAAAVLMAAGAKGSPDSSQVVARANMLGSIKRVDDYPIKTDTPEALIRSLFFLSVLDGMRDSDFDRVEAPEALIGMSAEERKKEHESARHSMKGTAAISDKGVADLVLSLMQVRTDQNGEDGYRVRMLAAINSTNETLFVSKDGNEYRILGEAKTLEGVGWRVLGDVKKGDLAAARKWLDWVREDVKIAGGDDPLDGPVFPRIWSKGSQGGENEIRYAASVLIGESKHGKEAIPALREAMEKTTAEPAKTYAEIAYVTACANAELWKEALAVAKPLAEGHPESPRMAAQLMHIYTRMQRWSDVEAVASERLARDPEEMAAGRAFAEAKAGEGKFQESEALSRKMADSAKGSLYDWNQFGWFALFAGDLTAEKISRMQQAMGTAPDAGILHTLATMYADAGKGTEARETILTAMRKWGLAEPDSNSWLVFGRLAEQFGVLDEAEADYKKVKNEPGSGPFSSYVLAQRRLAGLRK